MNQRKWIGRDSNPQRPRRDVIYSHVQPTRICLRSEKLGANGGSRVSRTPCRSRHALCSKQAHASRDSASRFRRKEEDSHLTPLSGRTLLSKQVRDLARFSFHCRRQEVERRTAGVCSMAPPGGRWRSRSPHSGRPCASRSKRAPSLMDSPSMGQDGEI